MLSSQNMSLFKKVIKLNPKGCNFTFLVIDSSLHEERLKQGLNLNYSKILRPISQQDLAPIFYQVKSHFEKRKFILIFMNEALTIEIYKKFINQ